MTQLLNWLPADGWPRFVADAIWQSTLIAVVGLLCVHFIARRPTTRALACLVTMLVALAAPLVSTAGRSFGWGLLSQPLAAGSSSDTAAILSVPSGEAIRTAAEAPLRYPANATTDQLSQSTAPAHDRPSTEHVVSPIPTNGSQQVEPMTVLFVLWWTVSGGLLVRLFASALRTRRLLKSALPCQVPEVLSALRDAARQLNVVPPTALISAGVKSPTVFAFGRGVVVLPPSETMLSPDFASAATNQSRLRSRWIAIFCHELGHIRRRDGWNRLASELVLAIIPWQPLHWLLHRDYLRFSEEACDDWAVAAGADPLEFAALLTDLVPSVPHMKLGAAIMSTDARSRILRLLSMRETPRPRTTLLHRFSVTVTAFVALAAIACAQQAEVIQAEEAAKPTAERSTESPDGIPMAVTKEGEVIRASRQRNAEPTKPAEFVYVVEPPDIVLIDPIRLLPKGPLRVEKLDQLQIDVAGLADAPPINGLFKVDSDGEISLGPVYGRVEVAGMPLKLAIQTIEEHLKKFFRQPQVALTIAEKWERKQIRGNHLISVDGSVNLGSFGSVQISGMTIDEARRAIERKLREHFDEPSIKLNVAVQNSKVFYVILEGGPDGDRITRFPWNGSETVLDALAQVNAVIRKDMRIWISRPSTDGEFRTITVDWSKLKSGEISARDYRLRPGDRVFLQDDTKLRAKSKP